MAKKQTRRTVSLSRPVYDAITHEAARRQVSAAVVVEDALRLAGIDVPAVEHQTPAAVAAMRAGRGYAVVAVRPGNRLMPANRPSLERQLLGDGIANALGFE